MGEFFSGIRGSEAATSIRPSANVNASLAVVVATAPIHRLSGAELENAKPGSVFMIRNPQEAAQTLGVSATDDSERWGISEVCNSHFALFNVAPIVAINVFDPSVHKKSVTAENLAFLANTATLANAEIINDINLYAGQTVFVKDVDFIINSITGVITVIENSSLDEHLKTIGSADVRATYTFAAPELVTPSDVIGGYDITTEIYTGLELISKVFPKYGAVPGIILTPNFSQPMVTAVKEAKSTGINAVFNCVAFSDISDKEVPKYSDVVNYKNKNNLLGKNTYLCWGRPKFGEKTMNLSTQAAGVTAIKDNENNGIPFVSPSNNSLQCQAILAAGKELWFGLDEANTLKGNGVATATAFPAGINLWGTRTAAYPIDTDVKNNVLSNRRMLNWYQNRFILTYWNLIDGPMNRVVIEMILNSEQKYLNSLTNTGAILGGRIEFNEEENSPADLLNGKGVFHSYLGLVPNAEYLHLITELDTFYLQALFG